MNALAYVPANYRFLVKQNCISLRPSGNILIQLLHLHGISRVPNNQLDFQEPKIADVYLPAYLNWVPSHDD
jgi:hypothetical protein